MIYVFYCPHCGEQFEVWQKMKDPHVAKHCNKAAKRVFTPFETERDCRWTFTKDINGKMYDIRSKRQYMNILKQHGLAPISLKDRKNWKKPSLTDDDSRKKYREIAKGLTKELIQRNVKDFLRGKGDLWDRDIREKKAQKLKTKERGGE